MKRLVSQKVVKARDRVVRFSMYDFIAAVHARPQIWERQHPNYHNREKREQAWQEVARRLHAKFDAMPTSEQKKTVLMLTKRWKNTRDSFFRAQRRSRSQLDQDDVKTYIYEKEMRFLTRSNEEGGPTDNNIDVLQQSSSERVAAEDKKMKVKDEVTPAATNGKTVKKRRRGSRVTSTSAARAKRRRTAALSAAALADDGTNETQPENNISAESNQLATLMSEATALKEELLENKAASAEIQGALESDPDQSFFDSIKPVVRNMSMDQKLDFQIEVLKLLKGFRGSH